jgi:glycosyltransferase involved in cell wall biosynthesis
MIELGFRDVRVLPIAVDFDDLDEVAPNPYVMDFFDEGYENLLFVGRISPNKRQDQLIRFFDHYQREIQPKSRLFLVGGYGGMEPYCNHLLQLIGEKKATNIILSGHVHLNELVAYYRLADVFVCVSEHEGFCVPLLESMHFGVPIVALDSTGVTATLGDAGIKVKESSETSLAFAVKSLLENKHRIEETVETQRQRLGEFDKGKIDVLLREYIEEISENA